MTLRPALRPSLRGHSLLNLLLGLAMSSLVLGAVMAWLPGPWRERSLLQMHSRQQQDLRLLLQRITQDLRMAEQVGQAWQRRSTGQADGFAHTLRLADQQVQWKSDLDGDGLVGESECAGFWWDAGRGELERIRGCKGSTEPLNDPAVLFVSDVQWRLECRVRGPWVQRRMHLTLRLRVDPQQVAPTWTLQRQVVLRNDVPATPWPSVCGDRS
ncbi:MAG: hypothetical protein RIQ97_2271 [Pseudomonadota bacterium]|jgi:type II secretory pathway component PulJ